MDFEKRNCVTCIIKNNMYYEEADKMCVIIIFSKQPILTSQDSGKKNILNIFM
jgi:hypothetical protein